MYSLYYSAVIENHFKCSHTTRVITLEYIDNALDGGTTAISAVLVVVEALTEAVLATVTMVTAASVVVAAAEASVEAVVAIPTTWYRP